MNFYYPGLYIHKGYIQPMIQEHLGSHHIEEENTHTKKKEKKRKTYYLNTSLLFNILYWNGHIRRVEVV